MRRFWHWLFGCPLRERMLVREGEYRCPCGVYWVWNTQHISDTLMEITPETHGETKRRDGH